MGFTNGAQVMERESGADPAILIVPGWSGSGPSHWQTIWEREHPEYRRVVIGADGVASVPDAAIARRHRASIGTIDFRE